MDSAGLNVSGVTTKDVRATAEAQRLQKTSHTVMAGSTTAGLPEEITGGAYGLPPPEAGYINSVDMEMLLFAEQSAREKREREEAEALAKYRLATSSIALKSQAQRLKVITSSSSMLQGGDGEMKIQPFSQLPKFARKRKLKPEDSKGLSSDIVVDTTKRRFSSSDGDENDSGLGQNQEKSRDSNGEKEPEMFKRLVAYSSGSEDDDEVYDNSPRRRSGGDAA